MSPGTSQPRSRMQSLLDTTGWSGGHHGWSISFHDSDIGRALMRAAASGTYSRGLGIRTRPSNRTRRRHTLTRIVELPFCPQGRGRTEGAVSNRWRWYQSTTATVDGATPTFRFCVRTDDASLHCSTSITAARRAATSVGSNSQHGAKCTWEFGARWFASAPIYTYTWVGAGAHARTFG